MVEQQSADRSRPIYRSVCNFHASSDADALSKARGWARYHGFETRDVDVVKVDPRNVSPSNIHDEWFR